MRAGGLRHEGELIGVARDGLSEADYRERVREWVLKAAGTQEAGGDLEGFLQLVSYHALDARKDLGWSEFAAAMQPSPERTSTPR